MQTPTVFSEEARSTPARLLDEMSRWYLVSRAIHVAAEVGIADAVGNRAAPAAEVAAALGVHGQALERILRLLAAYGVFQETEPGFFRHSPLSELLRSDHAQSLCPNLQRIGEAWWRAAGALGHAVETGESAFRHANGIGFFEYLAQNPEQQKRFDMGMAKISDADDTAVAEAYEFARFRRVVDVGGGRGGLLAQILRRTPETRGVLFDQPQVVASPVRLEEADMLDRCERIGGDFFEAVPGAADCYVIKGTLHDFADAECVTILGNCREAMADDGRVLVVERLLPTSHRGPHANILMDVQMMALLGGRERGEDEWRALLAQAGLRLLACVPTASDFSLIEAAPDG